MDCRHCGTKNRSGAVACRTCEVRLEPVFVDIAAAPACPRHAWILSLRPGVYVMRPGKDEERTDELRHDLFQTLLAWWPGVTAPVAWILDYRQVIRWHDFSTRSEDFAAFARQVAPLAEDKTICHAVIARDDVALGALRTMFWQDVLKFPRRFFSDYEEGVSWVSKQIRTTHSGFPSNPASAR